MSWPPQSAFAQVAASLSDRVFVRSLGEEQRLTEWPLAVSLFFPLPQSAISGLFQHPNDLLRWWNLFCVEILGKIFLMRIISSRREVILSFSPKLWQAKYIATCGRLKGSGDSDKSTPNSNNKMSLVPTCAKMYVRPLYMVVGSYWVLSTSPFA